MTRSERLREVTRRSSFRTDDLLLCIDAVNLENVLGDISKPIVVILRVDGSLV